MGDWKKDLKTAWHIHCTSQIGNRSSIHLAGKDFIYCQRSLLSAGATLQLHGLQAEGASMRP